jgi:carbonic anhydrase/acetyltransferase-like protein (isoleucine patch superfamily)
MSDDNREKGNEMASEITKPMVSETATVAETVRLRGRCWILNNAVVEGEALISGNARVGDNARVYGSAHINGEAFICDSAQVHGFARVSGNAGVLNKAEVFGDAYVSDNARVSGNARVYGNAWICDEMFVGRDADVFHPNHVFYVSGLLAGSVTMYRTATGHRVQAGCQNFTLSDDLEELAKQNFWDLPPRWKAFRDLMLDLAADWHSED